MQNNLNKTLMKTKHVILSFSIIALLSIIPFDAFSQGKAGGPPPWAPAHGYRAKTRHIYFPEHNFYFDIQQGVYIYLRNGSWTVAAKLPSLFSSAKLSTAIQIELDLSSEHPQKYNNDHLVKYKVKPKKQGKPGNGNGNAKRKGKGRH
jgi:hypothetical protein